MIEWDRWKNDGWNLTSGELKPKIGVVHTSEYWGTSQDVAQVLETIWFAGKIPFRSGWPHRDEEYAQSDPLHRNVGKNGTYYQMKILSLLEIKSF